MQPDDFPEIDTRTASVAQAYDALLGGIDNYEIDRRAADGLEDLMPGSYTLARNNRRYLERAVRYLAGECGIRQFILDSFGGHWGRVRSPEEVAGFFDGLETVPPGLVSVTAWRPDGTEEKEASSEWFEYGGVGRKP